MDTRFDVLVNGVKVGEIVKNKHGMWWGHFCPDYTVAARGVHEAPMTHKVLASRRKSEVVAAVVRAEVGLYVRQLDAAMARTGQSPVSA